MPFYEPPHGADSKKYHFLNFGVRGQHFREFQRVQSIEPRGGRGVGSQTPCTPSTGKASGARSVGTHASLPMIWPGPHRAFSPQ